MIYQQEWGQEWVRWVARPTAKPSATGTKMESAGEVKTWLGRVADGM